MSISHIHILLESMANRLARQIAAEERREIFMIGIHTGGVWIAEHLHRLLGLQHPLGRLSIAFYRDDFTSIGLHPHVKPSVLPCSVDNRHIILVDDVIYTGRTIRAALNEIFDYGRPASVQLAVLIERNGRELPIQPHVVGGSLCLDNDKYVKLCGPDPLYLETRTVNE